MERTTDFPCLLLQRLIEFPRKPKRQRDFRGLFFCHALTSSRDTSLRAVLCTISTLIGQKKDLLD